MPAKVLAGAAIGGLVGYKIGRRRVPLEDEYYLPNADLPPPPHLKRISIALDQGLVKHERQIQGDTLIVENVSGEVSLRLDSLDTEPIPLHAISRLAFDIPFWRLIFDAPAQPGGHIDLLVGTGLEVVRPPVGALVRRADIFNQPLPAAETNLIPVSITPALELSTLRLYVCFDVAGVLRISRTRPGEMLLTEDLNTGALLVAGASYMFDILWSGTDQVNFLYGASPGTIRRFLVHEMGGA